MCEAFSACVFAALVSVVQIFCPPQVVGYTAPAPVQYTGPVTFAAAPKCMSQESYAAVALLGVWSTIALRRKCAVESL